MSDPTPCRECGTAFDNRGRMRNSRRRVCDPCQTAREVRRRRMRSAARIPDAVRREVIERDGHACRYCGRAVLPGSGGHYPRRDRLELDHIVPVSRGGASTTANLVVCCLLCNRRKHGREVAIHV